MASRRRKGSRAVSTGCNCNGGNSLVEVSKRCLDDDVKIFCLVGLESSDGELDETSADHFANQIGSVDFSADGKSKHANAK